jgi:hypothetical protein
MTMSMTIKIVTLCRGCTTLPLGWRFHHPSVAKSLYFSQHTLSYLYDLEITTKSFTIFPNPQNIHTKVSPLWIPSRHYHQQMVHNKYPCISTPSSTSSYLDPLESQVATKSVNHFPWLTPDSAN